jgi:hypothetical protein
MRPLKTAVAFVSQAEQRLIPSAWRWEKGGDGAWRVRGLAGTPFLITKIRIAFDALFQ